eukprot:TRINITY_DN15044_c1_g3_i1.p1 TRINITY_DN15044_c1_g3~~TRINITY_DN15044_c1_g3_i1.p1  ORF type:complete len:982 (+),score=295.58 TRINITY_DN15044_c1_g3_i1:149-3094(+)
MGYDTGASASSPPVRAAASPLLSQGRLGRHSSPLHASRRGGTLPYGAPSAGMPAMKLPLLTALLRGGSPNHIRPSASPLHGRGGDTSPRRRCHSARAGAGYQSHGRTVRSVQSPAALRPTTPRSLRPGGVDEYGLDNSLGEALRRQTQASTPRASTRQSGGISGLNVHLPQRRTNALSSSWSFARLANMSARQDTPSPHRRSSELHASVFASQGHNTPQQQGLRTPLSASPQVHHTQTPQKQRNSGASSSVSVMNSSAADTDLTVGYSDTPSPLTHGSDEREDDKRAACNRSSARRAGQQTPLAPVSAPPRAPSPKTRQPPAAAPPPALQQLAQPPPPPQQQQQQQPRRQEGHQSVARRLSMTLDDAAPTSPAAYLQGTWSRTSAAPAAVASPSARRGRAEEGQPQTERQRQRALSAHASHRPNNSGADAVDWIQELVQANEAARATPQTPTSTRNHSYRMTAPSTPTFRMCEEAAEGQGAPSASANLSRALHANAYESIASPRFTHTGGERPAAAPAAAPAAPARKEEKRAHVPSSVSNMVCTWTANGQEDQSKYGVGGYLRIRPGDVLGRRYHVLDKLGWGEFATVWLAWDSESLKDKGTSPCKQFVAIKVSKCAEHVANATRDEAALLAHIGRMSQGHGACSLGRMLESFTATGEYGNHVAMVFPVLGQNILCLVEQAHRHREKIRTCGLSAPRRSADEIKFVKATLRATLRGLAELHRIQIVHTDLKPENILLTAVSQKIRTMMRNWQDDMQNKGRIKWDPTRLVSTSTSLPEEERDASYVRICDFGLSSLLDPAHQSLGCGTHARRLQIRRRGVAANPLGVVLQTREYRAPEVLFGSHIGVGADVWSVGCMAFELTTGTFLMDPKKDPKRRPKPEEEINADHLCMMQQIIGTIPSSVARANGRHMQKYFDSEGKFRYKERGEANFPHRSLKQELLPFLHEQDAADLAHFIQMCLFSFDPFQRPTAEQLLKHAFVTR